MRITIKAFGRHIRSIAMMCAQVSIVVAMVSSFIVPASSLASPRTQPVTIICSAKRTDTGDFPADTFSIANIYSVYIYTHWKHITGSHDEAVKLYGPDGRLYQTCYVSFTTRKLPSMTKIPYWSPHQVDIILAPKVRGAYVVRTELPVAGTWAMRLPGTWTARVYLDNKPTCYGETSFTLVP